MRGWLTGVSRNTVRRYLREGNAEIPAERLVIEAQKLQPLATPYTGRSIRSLCAPPSQRKAIVGYQHPLSVSTRSDTCRSGESRPTSSSRSWRSATIWPQKLPQSPQPGRLGWRPSIGPLGAKHAAGTSAMTCPELASHQRRLRPSVARPSCTISPRFSRQEVLEVRGERHACRKMPGARFKSAKNALASLACRDISLTAIIRI